MDFAFSRCLEHGQLRPNSNLSQFFIVEGYPISDEMLEQMTQFPAPVVEKYRELGALLIWIGGIPSLAKWWREWKCWKP